MTSSGPVEEDVKSALKSWCLIVCMVGFYFAGVGSGWFWAWEIIDTTIPSSWYPYESTMEKVRRLAEDDTLNRELLIKQGVSHAKAIRELTEYQRGERLYEGKTSVVRCPASEGEVPSR